MRNGGQGEGSVSWQTAMIEGRERNGCLSQHRAGFKYRLAHETGCVCVYVFVAD